MSDGGFRTVTPAPAETLRLIPLVTRLSRGRQAAIAARMTTGRWYRKGARVPSDGPPDGVRVLAAEGRLAMRVVQAGVSHPDAWRQTHSTPMLFGGALLPGEPADAAPDLELTAQNQLYVFHLTSADIAAIANSRAWRRSPHAWRRFVTQLRIAALLRASPDFHRLSRQDCHALAVLMHRRQVQAGEWLTRADQLADRVVVLGRGTRVSVTRKPREGAQIPLRPQGYGCVVGTRAVTPQTLLGRLIHDTEYEEDAQVIAGGWVVELPLLAIRRLYATQSWFPRFAQGLLKCWDHADFIVDALSRCALLEGLPRVALYDLIQGAMPAVWRVETHPPPPIEQTAGLIVVMDGELLGHQVKTRTPAGGRTFSHFQPVRTFRPGDVAGEEAFVLGADAANHLRPRVPTRLVFISEHRLYDVFGDDPRFEAQRVRLRRHMLAEQATRTKFQQGIARRLNLCLFEPLDRAAMAQIGPHLVAGLSRAAQLQFAEDTCVIELLRGTKRTTTRVRDGVAWIRPSGVGRSPVRALQRGVEALPQGTENVLIRAGLDVDLTRLREVVDHVVYVNKGPTIHWPQVFPTRTPFVYAALLPPKGQLDPVGHTPFPPSTVRLRLDLATADAPLDDGGKALYEANRDDFDRWARAIMDRRVGIALGGGGAWGYAHIAVLRHLHLAGVPIDVVSGSSFGAVVGAYYCARGLDGLGQLLEDQRKIGLATTASYLTGVFLEAVLNQVLASERLEEMTVPFLPICTDLVTASQVPLLRGTVGHGVRASGSLPPMFAPTTTPDRTYVDGGLSSNVPATALQTEGARLLISSDIVPPPQATPMGQVLISGTIGQVLRDLNLVRRMEAAFQGSQTMFNTAGEMSAAVAPVHFESNKITSLPFVFTAADKIIEGAITEPAFWAAVQNATTQWDTLSRLRP